MALADRIRKLREDKGLSQEELATKAGISKTYLWELERDTTGTKKPSADVMLKIAKALSTTLADVMALETVTVHGIAMEIPPSLQEFQRRMAAQSNPLSEQDLSELAQMKFRGGQPQTADEWHQLFFLLSASTRRREP
jgi:transcriptional regulator with XRE-family HTH domain